MKMRPTPLTSAVEALQKLSKDYNLYIFTTRANDRDQRIAITEWLKRYGMDPGMKITNIKDPAIAYIDDRGIRFTNWPDMVKYFT